MDRALELGIDFIDTAELYPVPPTSETANRTEFIVGRWLKARGNRDQLIIATKVASLFPGMDRSALVANRSDPPLENAGQPMLSKDQIKSACDASLRRLQTDYIDLYQIHWPSRYVPLFGFRKYSPEKESVWQPEVTIEEQVSAMGELIKEGKIKYWGVSNETTYGICQLCETAKRLGIPLPISIQNDFSLVVRTFEQDLAEACAPRNYNIGLLAYGALSGGTLAGKYLDGNIPGPNSRHVKFPGFQPRYHAPRTMAAAADYAALAKAHGLTPAQLAQAWAAKQWYMGSVIIGATSIQQLEENSDACLLEISEEVEKGIEEIWLKHGNTNLQD